MNHMFHGFDMDRTMLRIGAMNMMTHGVESPFIEYRDSLSDQKYGQRKSIPASWANPPFKAASTQTLYQLTCLRSARPKRRNCLFLTLFVQMLKMAGGGACIVPDGVFFGSSDSAQGKEYRKELIEIRG